MLLATALLLGQAETKDLPGLATPIILVMIFISFWLLILRPQQKREKQQKEALFANLKKNDEVVTLAGIIGIVQSIKDGADEVTLKIDDNTRMRILKSSIVRINKEVAKEGSKN